MKAAARLLDFANHPRDIAMQFQRRDILTAVALAGGAAATAQAQTAAPPGADMSLTACIDDCWAAHRACVQAAQSLAARGDGRASAGRIATLTDCAEICAATANALLRNSPTHGLMCGGCARLCEACAQACGGDPTLQACAQTCRRCAASCQHMAM